VIPRLDVAPFTVRTLELSVRVYRDGHFFMTHKDVPPQRAAAASSTTGDDEGRAAAEPAVSLANRVLSFVYFFHKVPRRYTGGELLLFDSNPVSDEYTATGFTTIVPEDNALVIFPSRFFHCVVPIRCAGQDFLDSRFVVNGFVHKRGEGADAES
jgi:Rps23 Pro-64 3,4-dihydroxylase Tpa1-like proline 4-hydroxylase